MTLRCWTFVASLGLWYFAEVPHNTRLVIRRPGVVAKDGAHGSAVAAEGADSIPVERVETAWDITVSLPDEQWGTYKIKEGAQGPHLADFAFVRGRALRSGKPGPEVWLVLRLNRVSGELKTYLCNAPSDTPHSALVRQSGMRWPIETCFEDGKGLLGMGDYEVRTWRGWHHHMTLCILAHFFLVRLQIRLKKKHQP